MSHVFDTQAFSACDIWCLVSPGLKLFSYKKFGSKMYFYPLDRICLRTLSNLVLVVHALHTIAITATIHHGCGDCPEIDSS